MKALVVGFGSAGRRHKRLLEQRGFDVRTVDPDPRKGADLDNVKKAFGVGKQVFDLAVVASPPDCHPEHLRILVDAGVPKILCEKPLCGWDQMDDVVDHPSIRVAYNYRYHPLIAASLGADVNQDWFLISILGRNRIPPWGFLLDHVSHDFDIMFWKAGLVAVKSARWMEFGPVFGWWIQGETVTGKAVRILDLVSLIPGFRRLVTIHRSDRHARWVTNSQAMFARMMDSVLCGYRWATRLPTIQEALRVQELLEAARAIAENAPEREI